MNDFNFGCHKFQGGVLYTGGRPGEVYPARFEARRIRGEWAVIDVIGWDGFREVDSAVIATGLDRGHADAMARWNAWQVGLDAATREVYEIADALPSGAFDPRAGEKLDGERDELREACALRDFAGALTELADVHYYGHKAAIWTGRFTGADEATAWGVKLVNDVFATDLTVDDARAFFLAKYGLRAQPSNPKDDAAERAAVMEAYSDR